MGWTVIALTVIELTVIEGITEFVNTLECFFCAAYALYCDLSSAISVTVKHIGISRNLLFLIRYVRRLFD